MDRDKYIAMRGDFILKVDNFRPILYPLDNNDTHMHFLNLAEGLILSLISGHRTVGDVENLYKALFPDDKLFNVIKVLSTLNSLVMDNKTASGIGQHGLFEYSSSPIDSIHQFDPREFVINPNDHKKQMISYKTKRRLNTPISIMCVFTSHCTTNCAYCYADRKTTLEMELSRWQELIIEMKGLGIRLCALDNGDVFARKEGIDFCETLIANDIHFLLSTKSYVSADHVRRLVEAGLRKKVNGVVGRTVQLSIDAIDKNMQRRLYGVSPIAERTAQTFDNFMRYGVSSRIKAVITGFNFDQPKALVDYFYPRGARQFHFVRYNRSFYKHVDKLFLTKKQTDSFRKQYDKIIEQYPDIECWQNVLPSPRIDPSQNMDRETIWQNRKGCGGGWMSLNIASNGKAFLCEQMKMSDEFFVGDLRKQSIMEVWHSEKLLDFIHPLCEKFKGTICYSCNEFEQCMWEQGRCYRDAYFSYGTIYDAPPQCPSNERPGLRLL